MATDAISDDWDFDYANERMQHVDGIITYANNAGNAPNQYDFILGDTTGAVGQVIGGSDLGGVAAAGTLIMTNVVGVFNNVETLTVLDRLLFDQVANGGFAVGDNILEQGAGTGEITVLAIEYNLPNYTSGDGYIYGIHSGEAFADADILDIDGGTASVAVADAAQDDGASFTAADMNGYMALPGTANENRSVILHWDAGNVSWLLPQDCAIADQATGATGNVQRIYGGSGTQGSIRVVNSNQTGGNWTDGNALDIEDVVFYDAQVGGQVFAVDDKIVGSVSAEEGRVLYIDDHGDDTGMLVLGGSPGAWNDGEDLEVDGVKVAEIENVTFTFDYGDINIPSGLITYQRPELQGGIYDTTILSLNIVRSSNSIYTYAIKHFKLQGQMDDTMPIEGKVRDQLYRILGNWYIPDLSFRFTEDGSWQDVANNNIWTNFNSFATSTLSNVGDHGFFLDATNPTPAPALMVEQDAAGDGGRIGQWWLNGHIDIIIKVKTKTDTQYIDENVTTIGQLINGGEVDIHDRNYGNTYDWVTITKIGGIAPVPLNTAGDDNNPTGTRQNPFINGGAGAFTVGEEITETTGGILRVGIVTASDAGAAGDVDYILKSPTDFSNGGTIVGGVSAKSVDGGVSVDLVAGYGTDVSFLTVTDKITGGSVTVPGFIVGEVVTQAVTGATGYYINVDSADALYVELIAGAAFAGNNNITGAVATYAVPAGVYEVNQLTFLEDLEDGSGEEAYTGFMASDVTGADAQTSDEVYEYAKFYTRMESVLVIGKIGNLILDREGRFFKSLQYPQSSWALVKDCPIGDFADPKIRGARGWYIEKDELHADDIQSFSVINNAGIPRSPPNLQSLTVSGLANGYEVAVYRTLALGTEIIQKTEFQVGAVGADNQAGDSIILVKAGDKGVSPLPADVPSTGIIRVLDPDPLDQGNYYSFAYASVNKATNQFTLAAGTIGDITGALDLIEGDNCFVVFIEETSAGASVNNTVQHSGADIFLFWQVREIGYEPNKGSATFTGTGVTIAGTPDEDEVVDQP